MEAVYEFEEPIVVEIVPTAECSAGAVLYAVTYNYADD